MNHFQPVQPGWVAVYVHEGDKSIFSLPLLGWETVDVGKTLPVVWCADTKSLRASAPFNLVSVMPEEEFRRDTDTDWMVELVEERRRYSDD